MYTPYAADGGHMFQHRPQIPLLLRARPAGRQAPRVTTTKTAALPDRRSMQFLYLVLGTCLLALACMLMAAPAKAGPFGSLFSRETTLEIKDEAVSLPLAGVTGKAAFYKVNVDGTNVIFFTLRDAAGRVRLALDACDACWQAGKGYKQTGDAMTCQKCGMVFPIERIGLRKGGCNPHPVNFTVSGETVVVPAEELRDGVRFFKGL